MGAPRIFAARQAARARTPLHLGYLGRITILCGVYFAAAAFGLSLAHTNSSISAVWAPSGIALAALVLGGARLWPGVMLGAFLANLFAGSGLPAWVAAGIALGNTLEAVAGAYLLTRVRFRPSLDTVKDVVALTVLAGVVSTTLSATIGTTSLYLGGFLDPAHWDSDWLLWWLGDLGGDLIVAPLLLVGAASLGRRARARQVLEAAVSLSVIAAAALLVFTPDLPLAYLLVPLLAAVAFRVGQVGAALGSLIIATIAIWFTAHGAGPFAHHPRPDVGLVLAQTFCAVAAITGLLVGAVTLERSRARRELEAILRTRTDQLETKSRELSKARELDRTKDEVVALVSHDLRTPLTSIRGYTELMLTDPEGLAASHRGYLEVIDRNSARLLGLVDDLLVVAQHKVGAFSVGATEDVDLGHLVDEGFHALGPAAADRGITLRMRGMRHGVRAHGNRDRLTRMLDNLLVNAVKYAAFGGIVEVRIDRVGDRACLEVWNDGPGIPSDQQQRIFERFERARHGADGGAKGFGLGLTIAHAIVEAHKGRIGVESSPAAGTTFRVELPLGADLDPASAEPLAVGVPTPHPLPSL